jgi:chorismate synthase
MASVFGNKLKISVFGQSHSAAIGVVIDGLPAGFRPDLDEAARFLSRRSPIGKKGVTARKEPDRFEIVSGLFEGACCGAPLCAMIKNEDVRSGDYDMMRSFPRPSHADYPAHVKYGGFEDYRGGGHFSGRLTAPLCFAGALAVQLLSLRGVDVCARVKSIGNAYDTYVDPAKVDESVFSAIREGDFPSVGDPAKMQKEIADAALASDSVGGQVECFVLGLPAGVGEGMFDSVESRISAAVFAIPAVKGIEFGEGFALTGLRASEANDPYEIDSDGNIRASENSNGGALGGLTTGMPLVFTAAFKPTPTISLPQRTVDLEKNEEATVTFEGRHDPCVAVRAVPCVESAAALALLDLIL